MAKPTTTTAAPRTTVVTIDGKPVTLPVFGPYGDKALHGSKLCVGVAKSDPTKRDAGDVLKHDAWAFEYWAPASEAEVVAFVRAKADVVMGLVTDALKSDARQDSWQENRGGAVTVDVIINGKLHKRQALAVVELLKASGVNVTVVPRVKADTTKS